MKDEGETKNVCNEIAFPDLNRLLHSRFILHPSAFILYPKSYL
jgi:hypothetical protein